MSSVKTDFKNYFNVKSVNAMRKGSQLQAREICMTAMPFNETLESVPHSTFNETRIEESFFNPEINFEYIFHCFSHVRTKARRFVHASWNLSSIMAVRSLFKSA